MHRYHFIKDEMLVHTPVCIHQNPKKIIVVGGCNNIKDELNKHSTIQETLFIDSQNAINEFKRFNGSRDYDVAIIATDKFKNNKEFWIEFDRLLDSKAVISMPISNIIAQDVQAKEELKFVGNIYPIVMPYRYDEVVDNKNVNSYLTLLSKFYHPTADLNLQRADLTDGFRYYNSDIAISAFSVPTFIYKNYLGIIKR